jgi:hypothetical protein
VREFNLGDDSTMYPTFNQLKSTVGKIKRAKPERSEGLEAIGVALGPMERSTIDMATREGRRKPFFFSKLFGGEEYTDETAALDIGLSWTSGGAQL